MTIKQGKKILKQIYSYFFLFVPGGRHLNWYKGKTLFGMTPISIKKNIKTDNFQNKH